MRLAFDASRLKRATASGSCTIDGFITLMALRRPIVGAELHVIGILGRADGTDLHDSSAPAAPAAPAAAPGSSTRSSLSPTMMREPCFRVITPRAAIATPLRL